MSEVALSNLNTHRAALAESLLIEMLSRVRHSQATPLYFGIDGHRVAAAALAVVEVGLDQDDPGLADTGAVIAAIESRALRALGDPSQRTRPDRPPLDDAELPSQLGTWMLHTHARLRDVHPLALDILGLLVEGDSVRGVSDELGLGLRLTRRIVADMRKAW